MAKRKNKIKIRRRISRDELFKKKEDKELAMMEYSLIKAFPDPEERLAYIKTLYNALGEELEDERTIEITA